MRGVLTCSTEPSRSALNSTNAPPRRPYTQGKTVDELVVEALTSYLGLQQLDHLSEYGRKRADALDLTEEDLPRLISEIRLEV